MTSASRFVRNTTILALASVALTALTVLIVFESRAQSPAAPAAQASSTTKIICPKNYVRVPARAPYTTEEFCVAKYEAKKKGKKAVSEASGRPWVEIKKSEVLQACRANGPGYDVISNAQWMALARDIETVGENWSGGQMGKGQMNRGHHNMNPMAPLAANSDDNVSCFGTEAKCDLKTWSRFRRTLRLSTGDIVWDLVGNVWDMIKDDTKSLGIEPAIPEDSVDLGPDSRFQQVRSSRNRALFGPATENVGWKDGIGGITVAGNGSVCARGSHGDDFYFAGLFSAVVGGPEDRSWDMVGFRCVWNAPSASSVK